MANSQCRKWLLVINNPHDCGLTHDVITEILMRFFPDYFCMADEIATTGTYHTHIFIYSRSPIRFNTLKNRLPTAHIEKAYGSAKENRDYIRKEGKWTDSDKAETSVEDSFFEYGKMPEEKEETTPKMYRLIENIKDGKRTAENGQRKLLTMRRILLFAYGTLTFYGKHCCQRNTRPKTDF